MTLSGIATRQLTGVATLVAHLKRRNSRRRNDLRLVSPKTHHATHLVAMTMSVILNGAKNLIVRGR
jgi:hypothetical protein